MYKKLSKELNQLIFTLGEEALKKLTPEKRSIFDGVTIFDPSRQFSTSQEVEEYARNMFREHYKVPSWVYANPNSSLGAGLMRTSGNSPFQVLTSVGPVQIYIKG